ncbi:MAG: hypothetical protein AAGI89_01250 [Pseudomonadota bacterium]
MSVRLKLIILVLMALTIFRTQTIFFVSSVEVFGGPAPNAWLGPWVSDATLGLLLPAMLYILWTKKGVRIWGVLIVYNAVGAFDYAHGLLTQVFHPMPAEMASAQTVYIGIGVFMVLQLIALALLFRRDVATSFAQ